MQYVARSCCPQYLADHQEKWTKPWIAYYERKNKGLIEVNKVKKPSGDHWLKEEIRVPLMADFHNNCCYCGVSIPTHQDVKVSKGDVDHFEPKVTFPEKVYAWTNLVWSCKSCNQQKGSFYSFEYPLLNPCNEHDCGHVEFIEDTGQYALTHAVSKDINWKRRFANNQQKTYINAVEICKTRKTIISLMRSRFGTVSTFIELKDKSYVSNIINNALKEILNIVNLNEFHLLRRRQYELLCREYPQVEKLLNTKE